MITNDKEIKESVSIVDIIKEHVDLTRKGASYQGLCPFHHEKTPSFSVSPNKGIYKCFGCGASGDGVQFLMDHKGMTYPEALEYIAQRAKVNVEYQVGDKDEWMKQHKELKDKQGKLKNLFTKVYTFLWNHTWQHLSLAEYERLTFAG
ncbi:MAG: CHC2 zinc finger domain-containing protein, partial [Saprospiraceae bacterium]|nr:CHC2 zinc finger domain-containing protein [Saprospiraceae bacterium]